MNCRRAEELFSDHRDGALAPPLAAELEGHVRACAACRGLQAAFADVADALGALPIPQLPPSLRRDLIEVAASKRTRADATPSVQTPPSPRLVAAASWLAVAATLLLVMVLRPPELATDFSRATTRSARDVQSFAVRSYHQAQRWFEDLNVLRMTVGVAFEDQIDQINEQLKDLESAGRRSEESEDDQSRRHLELDTTTRSFS